jgi:hypothetical protein
MTAGALSHAAEIRTGRNSLLNLRHANPTVFAIWRGRISGITLSRSGPEVSRRLSAPATAQFTWFLELNGWLDCRNKNYEVDISYNVRPNPGYCIWISNLHYVLYTGKFWKGAIDTAVIAIHFPDKIAKEQVLGKTSPSGYTILEKSVEWTFHAFVPTIESNIRLRIIDLKIYSMMKTYEAKLREKNVTLAKKLEAAKFYAGFAPPAGINFPAPYEIDSVWVGKEMLPQLSPLEKKAFFSIYDIAPESRPKVRYLAMKYLKHAFFDFMYDERIFGEINFKEAFRINPTALFRG